MGKNGTEIISNGSKWHGEEPDDLPTLIRMLATHPLRPKFGNCECDHDGGVQFLGNFSDLSHVFNIHTNDQAVIDQLRAAIAANRKGLRQ